MESPPLLRPPFQTPSHFHCKGLFVQYLIYSELASCPLIETLYVCLGEVCGGQALEAATEAPAEPLCWEKPDGLFPRDLVNGMGFVLCCCGHGSHMCNLTFSSSNGGHF